MGPCAREQTYRLGGGGLSGRAPCAGCRRNSATGWWRPGCGGLERARGLRRGAQRRRRAGGRERAARAGGTARARRRAVGGAVPGARAGVRAVRAGGLPIGRGSRLQPEPEHRAGHGPPRGLPPPRRAALVHAGLLDRAQSTRARWRCTRRTCCRAAALARARPPARLADLVGRLRRLAGGARRLPRAAAWARPGAGCPRARRAAGRTIRSRTPLYRDDPPCPARRRTRSRR